MKNRWKIWGIHFDLASKKLRVEELEKRLEEPGFWDDPEVSQQVMKELKGLQDSVKEIEKLYSDYEDMSNLNIIIKILSKSAKVLKLDDGMDYILKQSS